MNKAEYVQTVLAHMYSNRFPKEAWNKIDKIIEDYQTNKITLEERDSQIYLIADAYDSIKPSERWWENNARPNTRVIDMSFSQEGQWMRDSMKSTAREL